MKKQKSILTFETAQPMPLLSNIKILILIILQKGRFVELYGPNRSSIVFTTEEEEIKELFQKEYKTMVKRKSKVNPPPPIKKLMNPLYMYSFNCIL